MRSSLENPKIFATRREALAKKLNGAALIVASHPEHIRNHDVHYAYRQDSNLYYLTGFEEPESILLFRPGLSPETVLFVRKRDRERETWDGFRFGPEGTEEVFKIDKAYPIDEFETIAPKLLNEFTEVYYSLYKNPKVDQKFQAVQEKLKSLRGRLGYSLLTVFDADDLIGEMRLFKSDSEIENLRTACDIGSKAHIAAMKFARPGVNERQVEAVLRHHFLMNGSQREGYNFIVATGNNGTTLHYNFNDQVCKDGDLLLIDAGCEYNYFTSDITRTFPVNGRFTDEQARVYQGVLDIQKQIIQFIKPGIVFKELHEMGAQLLTDLMLDLGLLSGRKQDIMDALEHKKYYPHGIGHWLGMDVHDAGKYAIKGEPRPLQPGMVFTVEPGLYIPEDGTSVHKSLRGIGIRIEDNILVTLNGSENMTASCPKEIADLESIIGK